MITIHHMPSCQVILLMGMCGEDKDHIKGPWTLQALGFW